MPEFDKFREYWLEQDVIIGKMKKTPWTNPYDYDPFYNWRQGKVYTNAVYSDRLYQWDYKKYDELCKKYFGDRGQHWSERNPEQVEQFLQEFQDDPSIRLTAIQQQVNIGNGFPLWVLFYISDKSNQKFQLPED